MNMCDDGHEEIVFTTKKCPLCDACNELDYAKAEIQDLQKQIEKLTG